ncbi:hypothetical protein [Corynebacterium hindlerae]|uniref:hypothetical protein n=1 Tax=Corynebacterium hindlerae TaxID=699041 RepID=UPI0031B6D43B
MVAPISPAPGELMKAKFQAPFAGFLIKSFAQILISDRRLISISESKILGVSYSEKVSMVPLDHIASIERGRNLNFKLLGIGLLVMLVGIALCFTFIGIILGVPLLLVGAVISAMANEKVISIESAGGKSILLLTHGLGKEEHFILEGIAGQVFATRRASSSLEQGRIA